MPRLDPTLYGSLSMPKSPAGALHSEYAARINSPSSRFNSPRRLSGSDTNLNDGLLNQKDGLLRHRSNSVSSSNSDGMNSPRTPSGRSKSVYSDRFIPSRSGSQFDTGFSLLGQMPRKRSNSASIGSLSEPNNRYGSGCNENSHEGIAAFSMLLKSELLGVETGSPRNSEKGTEKLELGISSPRNIFRFKAPRQSIYEDVKKSFVFSSIGSNQPKLLSSPRKEKRKIAKVPFKVLDAPALQDDFYLNLVDWSAQNVLAVGLGGCVYLWSACTSKVSKLCDLGANDSVTSVSWTQRGTHLAVGTNSGEVQIWEASRGKKIRTMGGHSARVGTLAWNSTTLASGSRDRMIYQRDVRAPEDYTCKLVGHKQEVCGLRWSFDDLQLASGGNDNKLFIWSAGSSNPVVRFSDHTAAVKAIAWSPHHHGLLASGGGTADRCIRFWNTLTTSSLSTIDTGSQVCNLMWSKNVNEIVSTHGYSLNQIIVWKYPSMTKLATLTGHTYRVLYLAMSPDGQTIVTGAGDETLRFWNAFPSLTNKDGSRLGASLLFPTGADIR